jgi:tight adherence protein C
VLSRLGASRFGRWVGRDDAAFRRLELAGHPYPIEVVRGMQIVAGAAAALVVLSGGLGLLGPALAPLAAAAGSKAPPFVLARKARRRQEQIRAAVPDLVEILLATTEAGLGPPLALARTADALSGPLGDEIRAVVRQVELGTPWQVAMEQLIERTEVSSLRALTMALSRSQRLGSSLGGTLRRVVDDVRAERHLRAEELARRAPLKMLFPLVFLILPAFLLLTVGPVVLATIRSFR